ncbi:hypothetical protein C1X64_29880 [Pseudomonas sp. GW456-E7]|nr:hypothetical protein C1X64_29880 [Pseudomonas sp. GW456-E7]
MSNLGIGSASGLKAGRQTDAWAPLIKKCAILAMVSPLDQLYAGKYDECCAMLRAVTLYWFFTVNKTSVTLCKTAHAARQSIVLLSKKPGSEK